MLTSCNSGSPSFTSPNNVSSIDITVQLQSNGDARITQTWSGSFMDGTEIYLPIENLGDMDIADLTVSDRHGEYENIGEWDVDASFNEKAHKCGIATTDDGYELCFGISEYGDNVYTFSYTVTGLVGRYTDGVDGFLFQFANQGMSIYPADLVLRILPPEGVVLSDANSGIWAFGYEGTILFEGGSVIAQTELPLERDDGSSCIILLRLNACIIEPHRSSGLSFESLKENAFDGSVYEEEFDAFGFILMCTVMSICAIAVGFLIVYGIYRGVLRSKARRHMKKADYYRDIPCGGDLGTAYALARPFALARGQSFLSAALLRMISSGYISTEPEPDSPKQTQMTFIKQPPEDEQLNYQLYNALIGACPEGSSIATQAQLQQHITKRFKPVEAALNAAESYGRKELRERMCYTKPQNADRVFCLKDLTPSGISVLDQLSGFRNYLNDFTLINERTTLEVALWKEYMVYATLLEAADKVIEELRRIAPYYDATATAEIETFDHSFTSFWMLNNVIHSSYQAGYASVHAANASGGGGGSSFSGGGGFSGGGFGGGAR